MTAPTLHRTAGYTKVLNNPAPRAPITRRELGFLLLAANGNTNAAIASWSGVAVDTVNTSLRKTYRKLGVSDRAQAVAVALRLGLIGLDEITLPKPRGAAVPPAAASEAPGPRRSAAGASGGDVAGFNGGAGASSARRSVASSPSEAENALRGGSRGLAASARPSPTTSP